MCTGEDRSRRPNPSWWPVAGFQRARPVPTTHGPPPMTAPSPHHVLGVPESAGPDELRRAYRRRAFALHPDRNGGPDAHEAFLAVRAAYDALTAPPPAAVAPTDRGPVWADGFVSRPVDAAQVLQNLEAAAREAERLRRRR